MSRTWLVGGLSSLHDPLCVAALRRAGVAVEQLPPCDHHSMTRARAGGNHGQCNPAHYAVGAVVAHAARSGRSPEDFARGHGWVALGSCGPCRLAAFPLEWERVLGAAGLGSLEVLGLDQHSFIPAIVRERGASSAGRGLLAALITGDVIASLGHRLRPWVEDPDGLQRVLLEGVGRAAAAIEHGASLRPVLRELAAAAHALPIQSSRVLPRVLLVGEPWTTLHDGAPSRSLAQRIEALGAEVIAPKVVDWLRTLAWQRARNARLAAPEQRAAGRSLRALEALWRLLATPAGVFEPLEDPEALGAIAAPWYPPELHGGSAHLEVARSLLAARTRQIHLVISLKPFGCLPSSSLSDGVLGPLLRREPGAPSFLPLETTGDAAAAFESRVELALHGATLAAVKELELARASGSLPPTEARAAAGHATQPLFGPRTFACSAAERIARSARGSHAAARGGRTSV